MFGHDVTGRRAVQLLKLTPTLPRDQRQDGYSPWCAEDHLLTLEGPSSYNGTWHAHLCKTGFAWQVKEDVLVTQSDGRCTRCKLKDRTAAVEAQELLKVVVMNVAVEAREPL